MRSQRNGARMVAMLALACALRATEAQARGALGCCNGQSIACCCGNVGTAGESLAPPRPARLPLRQCNGVFFSSQASAWFNVDCLVPESQAKKGAHVDAEIPEVGRVKLWLVEIYPFPKLRPTENASSEHSTSSNQPAPPANSGRQAIEGRSSMSVQTVAAYRSALEVRTRQALPLAWAATQNDLGNALIDQANQVSGRDRAELLAQAIKALRSALEVRTREALPQDWAATQNNLGVALMNQAMLAAGQKRADLLTQAVTAYRSALEVYTRETLPQDWADTRSNLAELLFISGRFDEFLADLEQLRPQLPDDGHASLRSVCDALEILVLTALDRSADAKWHLAALRAQLVANPERFSFAWSWLESRTFVARSNDARVEKHRQRLLAIIDALSQPTNKALLEKLALLAR